MEVGRIARQHDEAFRRMRLQFTGVELISQADPKHVRCNGVDSIFRVPVRHQLHAVRHFDPDRVGPGLRGMTDDHREANRGRERREWRPIDVLRQRCSENVLPRLVLRCTLTRRTVTTSDVPTLRTTTEMKPPAFR